MRMDVRNFVHIKTIAGLPIRVTISKIKTLNPYTGSTPSSSQDFSGVVMTKNVVHKRMRISISNARVLVFDCPLDSDRIRFLNAEFPFIHVVFCFLL
jgi:chaperonin GroEL (HSP60 family)